MNRHEYLLSAVFLFIGCIGGLLGYICPEATADELINGSPVPEESPDGMFQKLLITEMYRRAGIKTVVNYYPLKRCSYLANSGSIDGETERVFDYNESFPNLIRVETSTRSFRFAVYAAHPVQFAGEGWEMFKNTPYTVEYQRGVKKAQEKLTELVPANKLSDVSLVELGVRKLIKGRQPHNRRQIQKGIIGNG